MGQVIYNPKTQNYEHENGRSVSAFDIRNMPHHRRKVLAMAGIDPSAPVTEPIPNETQIEMRYVQELLAD